MLNITFLTSAFYPCEHVNMLTLAFSSKPHRATSVTVHSENQTVVATKYHSVIGINNGNEIPVFKFNHLHYLFLKIVIQLL